MKSKAVNAKPDFKYVTPKKGERYKFIEGYEESEQIKRKIESRKYHNHDSYIIIRPEKPDPEIEGFNVYVALFVSLLADAFFDVVNLKTDKVVKLYTRPFLAVYKEAYKKGYKSFKETWAVSSDTLYGKNGQILERTIHRHYYHTNFKNFDEGWSYWERYAPIVFEMDTFERYGYYGGIIHALNEYKKLHPIMFSKFAKCNDTTTHTQTDAIKTNIRLEELKRSKAINHFNEKMPLSIPIDHFKILFESKNKGSQYLTESEFVNFINAAFLNQPLKEKLKLSSVHKGQIVALFHSFYQVGVNYEKTLHVRDKYIHLLTDHFSGWNFEQTKQNFKGQNLGDKNVI